MMVENAMDLRRALADRVIVTMPKEDNDES